METNKKLKSKVVELLMREKKLNISVVFMSHSYFAVPKTIRLNATHDFIMKYVTKENCN